MPKQLPLPFQEEKSSILDEGITSYSDPPTPEDLEDLERLRQTPGCAGITLIKGDLLGISKARRLSRATMRNIRQNLFFAFIYNFLGVPVAAGALYPVIGLLLNPMIASAAMSLSSVSVIGNALRLRKSNLD